MVKPNKNALMSQEDFMGFLDVCYRKCLDGAGPVIPSVEKLANDYLKDHKTPEAACKAMQKNQILTCTTSGIVTGFGGFATMAVALPANVTSVLYVQMRMIACTAYLAGYDLDSDQTRTFVYACLAGITLNGLAKQIGIKFGQKAAMNLIKKIPGKVLTKINQKVGFRFLTKFGSKGLINLGKLVPGFGAIVGGSLDYAETQVIARRAYDWFFNGDFETRRKGEEEFDLDNNDWKEEDHLVPPCPVVDVQTDVPLASQPDSFHTSRHPQDEEGLAA